MYYVQQEPTRRRDMAERAAMYIGVAALMSCAELPLCYRGKGTAPGQQRLLAKYHGGSEMFHHDELLGVKYRANQISPPAHN